MDKRFNEWNQCEASENPWKVSSVIAGLPGGLKVRDEPLHSCQTQCEAMCSNHQGLSDPRDGDSKRATTKNWDEQMRKRWAKGKKKKVKTKQKKQTGKKKGKKKCLRLLT